MALVIDCTIKKISECKEKQLQANEKIRKQLQAQIEDLQKFLDKCTI